MAALFSLLSAALFGANAVAVRLALAGSSATTVTAVSIITNTLALWIVSAFTGNLADARHSAAFILLAAGVLAPAMARLSFYTAIGLVGIARAVVASNTTPLFTAVAAALFLGERVGPALVLGTVAIVLGVALTTSGTAERPADNPASRVDGARRVKARLGVALALGTAVLAAVSIVMRKIALRWITQPALAASLTQTGALIALLPVVAVHSRREGLRAAPAAILPLIASALLSTVAFLAYFLALAQGDVSRVTPLSNTTPLFAILLLHFVFRRVETVTRRTLAGALLAVAGVILVMQG